MNLFILGPQGSGKGTQATKLAEKFGLVHFEMGKVLRSIAKSDNEWSRSIGESLNSGNLVPDELVRLISWDFISKRQGDGIIFEGYPRSVPQYEQLQDMLRRFGKKLNKVIQVNIPEAETQKRLQGRLTCEKCGEVYNSITDVESYYGKCKCGGTLIQRADDKPAAITRRLQIYRAQTTPIFEKAKAEGIALQVDGEQSIDKVFEDIVKGLIEA